MAEHEKNAVFEVVFDTPGLETYRVTASYTAVDERIYPGWTLLKDENGAIAAMVRSERVLMVRRAGSDPAVNVQKRLHPQVQVQADVAATPAQLAALRNRLAKAVL